MLQQGATTPFARGKEAPTTTLYLLPHTSMPGVRSAMSLCVESVLHGADSVIGIFHCRLLNTCCVAAAASACRSAVAVREAVHDVLPGTGFPAPPAAAGPSGGSGMLTAEQLAALDRADMAAGGAAAGAAGGGARDTTKHKVSRQAGMG